MESKKEKKCVSTDFFERHPPPGYLQEWGDIIQKSDREENTPHISVLVFRLGEVWLALETSYIKQVILTRAIHTIPHRNKNILLGIINYNGRLEICINLASLLQNSCTDGETHHTAQRMLVLEEQEKMWITPVDEIKGIYSWDLTSLKKIPSTEKHWPHTFVKNSKYLSTLWIGLLDGKFLFENIKNRPLQGG